jgi:short-subunit dehydrogenase
MDISGRRILVTGASSGIGAALAPQLAAKGATVGVVARRRERLEQVLAECTPHAPESRLWATNLGDLDAAHEVVKEAEAAWGGVDVLVNNAAIPTRLRLEKLTPAQLEETMRVNFLSPAFMTLALLPAMLSRGDGLIVNVSSTGGRIPIEGEPAYCASKFALAGWSETMRLDLEGTGVDVKLVLPGPIDTEIWDLPGNDPALFEIEKVPAAECAAGIVAAIEGDGFEYYVPPIFPGGVDIKELVVAKAQHCDQVVAGMAQFAAAMRNQ